MTTQAPPSRGFTALLFATSGAYAADQLTLAAQPLAAVLLMGASAREVGLLVAVHSAAWLIVSMPAGMLVDRLGRRRIASATQALAAAALALATVAAMKGWPIGTGALTTMVALRWIAPDPPMHAATTREPILAAMRAGAAFVRDEPLLRAIALCAICWNFAYFALVAVFVPFALERVGLHAGTVGLVQSIFGVGSIAAALLAAPLFARIAPRCFLVAGPASSSPALLRRFWRHRCCW